MRQRRQSVGIFSRHRGKVLALSAHHRFPTRGKHKAAVNAMISTPPSPSVRMWRDLHEPCSAAVWPVGVQLQDFTSRHAAEVHELLAIAYRHGGGVVPALDIWWPALTSDPEFDQKLVLIACDRTANIVGVAQSWKGAFVKDLAVAPDWRCRGLGRALLLQTFHVFRQRGALAVHLKVHADNAAAMRLYSALGMRRV